MNRTTVNYLAIEDFRADSNSAFGILYKKYFARTKKFVLNNKGRLEDAEDIFQDAVIILYEKLYEDDFQAYTCLGNYISGIAKNLWLKKLNNKNFFVDFHDGYYQNHKEEIQLAIENERDYLNKLEDYIKVISTHCQNLITDIFFKHKNIDEIQKKYKYSTKHNAQNQKYKCVEQIKKVKESDLK